MLPVSTLHGLNIEPDSISYIECSETSNQPSSHRRRPVMTPDLALCDLANLV